MMGAKRNIRKRNRRHKLYKRQAGKCFYCQAIMDINTPTGKLGMVPRNYATIEHLDDRFNPLRGQLGHMERTVLACWQCNFERGKLRQEMQPKEFLWELSGRSPASRPLSPQSGDAK